MNKNEKAAMLAELKVFMRDAHREARKSSGAFSIKAVQAQHIVYAVKHVLAAGLAYSMERKDIQCLFDELNRKAADEIHNEKED